MNLITALYLPLCLCFVGCLSTSLNPTVTKGLEAGDKLLDAVANNEFDAGVPLLADWTTDFLDALQFLIQTISEREEESEQMEEIRGLFRKYNDRLREMSNEYAKVRHLVDWSNVRNQFAQHERSIVALKELLDGVLKSPLEIRDEQKLHFIHMFDADYQNAASKIYSSLTMDHLIFSDNLIKIVRQFTRNHRKLVQRFLMGTFKTIVEGIELEATYLIFRNNTGSVEYLKRKWEIKLLNLQRIFVDTDEDIAAQWLTQSRSDVDFVSAQHPEMDKVQFAQTLYGYLKEKFYWRAWFVIVYPAVSGYDFHATSVCPNTIFRWRQNNRNVIVDSFDRATQPAFPAQLTQDVMDALPANTPHWQKEKPLFFLNILMAKGGMEEGKCTPVSLATVLAEEVDEVMIAEPGRSLYRLHTAKAVVYKYNFKVYLFA